MLNKVFFLILWFDYKLTRLYVDYLHTFKYIAVLERKLSVLLKSPSFRHIADDWEAFPYVGHI